LGFKTTNVTIVNTYHSPNAPLEEEQYRLLFQNFSRDAVILGDLNAYSTVFGASITNSRGRLPENLMDEHNMVTLNTGAGIYIRRTCEASHMYVAITTPNLARLANWTVVNDSLGSDLPIIISLNEPADMEEVAARSTMVLSSSRLG